MANGPKEDGEATTSRRKSGSEAAETEEAVGGPAETAEVAAVDGGPRLVRDLGHGRTRRVEIAPAEVTAQWVGSIRNLPLGMGTLKRNGRNNVGTATSRVGSQELGVAKSQRRAKG